jgi:hypothetical protein
VGAAQSGDGKENPPVLLPVTFHIRKKSYFAQKTTPVCLTMYIRNYNNIVFRE